MAVDFKKFWEANWDKVISVLISIVISGLIGYFSGILAIKSDLVEVRERVVKMETELATSIRPKTKTVDEHEKKIQQLTNELASLKQREDLAAQTKTLLQQLIEIERNKTANELRKILAGQ